jgi:hypothetical protein
MRKVTVLMAGLLAIAFTAGTAAATHNVPKQAKTMKGEFVKAFQECTSPNATTSNNFPACTPSVESDPACDFTTKGKGKWLAKYNNKGPDKVVGTSDDGDIDIQATLSGLDTGCHTSTLTLTATVVATADDCAGGEDCTVVTLTDFPLTGCTVDTKGNCKIKTTVNNVLPGTILAGKNLSIEVGRISMFRGASRTLSGGLLIP